MFIGITGSRKMLDRTRVESIINAIPGHCVIVSGGCRGVDSWAIEKAKNNGLKTIIHLPDLSACHRKYEYAKAYHARNQKIIDDCSIIIAFPATMPPTGGTVDTIKRAKKSGKHIFIDFQSQLTPGLSVLYALIASC